MRIGQALSSVFPMVNGTPQGSCLRPTFFNIMIDDAASSLVSRSRISPFADDVALWTRSRNLQFAAKKTPGGGLQDSAVGPKMELLDFWTQVQVHYFLSEKEGQGLINKN